MPDALGVIRMLNGDTNTAAFEIGLLEQFTTLPEIVAGVAMEEGIIRLPRLRFVDEVAIVCE